MPRQASCNTHMMPAFSARPHRRAFVPAKGDAGIRWHTGVKRLTAISGRSRAGLSALPLFETGRPAGPAPFFLLCAQRRRTKAGQRCAGPGTIVPFLTLRGPAQAPLPLRGLHLHENPPGFRVAACQVCVIAEAAWHTGTQNTAKIARPGAGQQCSRQKPKADDGAARCRPRKR